MVQIITGVMLLVLAMSIIAGWVMNIVWLIGQELVFNAEQLLSILGVVMFPLGALMGWLH